MLSIDQFVLCENAPVLCQTDPPHGVSGLDVARMLQREVPDSKVIGCTVLDELRE